MVLNAIDRLDIEPAPFHYEAYRCTDPECVDAIVEEFPLALVISHDGRYASHVPLFRLSGTRCLFGHVDGANPQFMEKTPFPARIVFTGPNSYIPPEAYVTRQLPTWNYISVHMTGIVQVCNEAAMKLDVLRKTVDQCQPNEAPYQFDAQDERVRHFAPHILVLQILVKYEEARLKLSQDKSPEDQRAALEYLIGVQAGCRRRLLEMLLSRFTKPGSNGG
jgi:transcriptional regulator